MADVCPSESMSIQGACWLLGPRGASCKTTCEKFGFEVRIEPAVPTSEDLWQSNLQKQQTYVPRILAEVHGEEVPVDIQHPWAAFECYVRDENRFHLAASWVPQDPEWSYSICSLACPCTPREELAG